MLRRDLFEPEHEDFRASVGTFIERDRCIVAHNAGELNAVNAAAAKAHTSELQNETVNRCLQLHGGYGFMLEYPIARAFLDSRAQTIYGGTTEIMKELVARDLGL